MNTLRIPSLALLSAFVSTPAFAQSNFEVTSGSMTHFLNGDYPYTIAGPGAWSLGDGRRATSALLNEPSGVAAESNGDVLISDTQDFRIRQVSG